MRWLTLLVLLVGLSACGQTQLYTPQDLRQVRQVYATLPPIYRSFRAAYLAGNKEGILRGYREERKACRLVDEIDKRDTIDPNINLFAASAGFDSLCNDIEYAYMDWAKKHGYPYVKALVPVRPQDVFVDGDFNIKKMPKQMQHPAAYS